MYWNYIFLTQPDYIFIGQLFLFLVWVISINFWLKNIFSKSFPLINIIVWLFVINILANPIFKSTEREISIFQIIVWTIIFLLLFILCIICIIDIHNILRKKTKFIFWKKQLIKIFIWFILISVSLFFIFYSK